MGDVDAIETLHWPQPPGWEDYDWTAWFADDEPDDFGDIIQGYGRTKEQAIAQLYHKKFCPDYWRAHPGGGSAGCHPDR